MTENILATFREASEAQYISGINWYSDKHSLCLSFGDDVWRSAGVISSYSPLTPWWRNVELATDSINSGIARTDTLPNNYKAAQRILDGEPTLDVLKGTKTRHFAEAIALNGMTDKVTVDSIAYSAATGVHTAAKKISGFGVKMYREIQAAYQDVADIAELYPCQLQAIVWVVWRDAHPNKSAVKGTGI